MGSEAWRNCGSRPMIKTKVSSNGSHHHEIEVPAHSTFGDLKNLLFNETGLEPKEQWLLFQGKERENEECLHMVGVKDMSKVVLLEDPASREKKLQAMKRDNGISVSCIAIASVKAEVDNLAMKVDLSHYMYHRTIALSKLYNLIGFSWQVAALDSVVHSETKLDEKEFVVLTELLMLQLLRLDGIEAEGEAKVQRRVEVCRVQNLVDTLDNLKARNSNSFGGNSNHSASLTTKWEAFESGVGSLSAPAPRMLTTRITNDWQLFD
ncbi:hypothetical protein Scep_015563 [Stephania cephalantha]|uniref:BAG family molecular chaperone regulator 4 n=1 Tax=Stephania cephalantha TaxID=152367 RepID=A0AAP0J326_9MAGN